MSLYCLRVFFQFFVCLLKSNSYFAGTILQVLAIKITEQKKTSEIRLKVRISYGLIINVLMSLTVLFLVDEIRTKSWCFYKLSVWRNCFIIIFSSVKNKVLLFFRLTHVCVFLRMNSFAGKSALQKIHTHTHSEKFMRVVCGAGCSNNYDIASVNSVYHGNL